MLNTAFWEGISWLWAARWCMWKHRNFPAKRAPVSQGQFSRGAGYLEASHWQPTFTAAWAEGCCTSWEKNLGGKQGQLLQGKVREEVPVGSGILERMVRETH